MGAHKPGNPRVRLAGTAFCAFLLQCLPLAGMAQSPPPPRGTDNFGPYNVTFLEGGVGESRKLAADTPVVAAGAAWSVSTWIRLTSPQAGTDAVIVGGIGDPDGGRCRCLILVDGRPGLRIGAGPSTAAQLSAAQPVDMTQWHAVAATFDGATARLYVDGQIAATQAVTGSQVRPELVLAPPSPAAGSGSGAGTGAVHFGGSLALFTLHSTALDEAAVKQQFREKPDFGLLVFHEVGVGWPWQVRAWRGLLEPQDPWTLPHAKTPPSMPVTAPVPAAPQALTPVDHDVWNLSAWRMADAGTVSASAPELSSAGFQDASWYAAVVPGTVLTTLIARGVYPDPYYGLNNMAIPESLNKRTFWYRTSFEAPRLEGRRLTLNFKGINYAAEIWLNGVRIGNIRGAFIRGVFDVTKEIRAGQRNALAVRISPPPHPGIPHEESIAAGPGENGGNLAIDGPTFVATEGWDWIPGIRDRNMGIWQAVELRASGALRILDPHVVTRLPLPRTDQADISITVPVLNQNPDAVPATLDARFEGVSVRKSISLPPGRSEVRLDPAEYPQLRVRNPRLWWPNGYGSPELYALTVTVAAGGSESDSRSLRFGVRELTYELSLFDHLGRLRRVEVDPTLGSSRSERLIDVKHEAIKKVPGGWAESLTSAGESSPAVRELPATSLAPYLVIRVNGVPIAARGGSWGTDDALKRVSRERLEPYFRLHREAHVNIIRNWLGQNTEDVFYDLADEYGLLILNDFWESTQDFQVEIEDPQLFLANARDVISRYRNHPSIAVWFGRNEGVPQPIVNEGLADLVATLDGTRHYTGSSNRINLQDSGPYNYRPPAQYFSELAGGFSVEVGTPSLSTLESLQASIPEADRWPISDTLAYHDWHFGGNGDIATFMAAMRAQYGEPTGLADFERKAQMMNLVTYRAIFEGFQAHLWTRNSGRLLWMTHPSWPSNMWQIYSSDYDTAGAYYGVKAACEPIHAQMNLPDFALAVVNTTRAPLHALKLKSRVVSLENRALLQRSDSVTVAANSVATLRPLELAKLLEHEGVVLVELSLSDTNGRPLSRNVYWQGRDDSSLRKLNDLAPQAVSIAAHQIPGTSAATAADAGGQVRNEGTADNVVTVELHNSGTQPALAAKLTAVDEHGNRVLPVFYSGNYVTLLPGASERVEIHCPVHGARCARVELRGWNVQPGAADIR
jgi:hypothetical protein